MPTPVWYLHFPSLAQCPLSLALFEGSYINRLLWRWPKRTQPWPPEKAYCMFVAWCFGENAFDGGRGTSRSQSWWDTPAFEHITLPGQGMTWHAPCSVMPPGTLPSKTSSLNTCRLNVVLPSRLRFPLLVLIALIFLHRCLQGWVMRPRL